MTKRPRRSEQVDELAIERMNGTLSIRARGRLATLTVLAMVILGIVLLR